MEKVNIGIIGGSGLYQMPELENVREIDIDTPFGKPSDAFIIGELDGVKVAFLPRHARGHKFLPTELPFRANIYAMKLLGVEYILSVSAVGSLQEQFAPTDMVIPDQFFDRTLVALRRSRGFARAVRFRRRRLHAVLDHLGIAVQLLAIMRHRRKGNGSARPFSRRHGGGELCDPLRQRGLARDLLMRTAFRRPRHAQLQRAHAVEALELLVIHRRRRRSARSPHRPARRWRQNPAG